MTAESLMVVQFIFYTLGSVFLLGLIAMVFSAIYAFFAMKKKVDETAEFVKMEAADFKQNFFSRLSGFAFDRKGKLGGIIATAVSGFIINKLKQSVSGRRR
ncbi:MAG: hypothetical protein ACOCXQ_03780 [Patescibacteria group bacterium]